MKSATLTITFEDGSSKVIPVSKAIEIAISPNRKQSISFNQTAKGDWVMSFTKPVFDEKKIKELHLSKNQ